MDSSNVSEIFVCSDLTAYSRVTIISRKLLILLHSFCPNIILITTSVHICSRELGWRHKSCVTLMFLRRYTESVVRYIDWSNNLSSCSLCRGEKRLFVSCRRSKKAAAVPLRAISLWKNRFEREFRNETADFFSFRARRLNGRRWQQKNVPMRVPGKLHLLSCVHCTMTLNSWVFDQHRNAWYIFQTKILLQNKLCCGVR